MPRRDTDPCPHCGADLCGPAIPEESKKWYGEYTNFSRVIGIEHSEIYDGTLYYRCPDCGGTWHRFSEGRPLHAEAAPFIHGPATC